MSGQYGRGQWTAEQSWSIHSTEAVFVQYPIYNATAYVPPVPRATMAEMAARNAPDWWRCLHCGGAMPNEREIPWLHKTLPVEKCLNCGAPKP